jgi:hypothetical protein
MWPGLDRHHLIGFVGIVVDHPSPLHQQLAMPVTHINLQGRKAIRRALDYGSFGNTNEPKRLLCWLENSVMGGYPAWLAASFISQCA